MKANIFISWSGPMSLAVAKALRDWLPSVIQAVEPWMSEDDIGKGIRWSSELASQLEQTRVGVICLTPENLQSPWIHFEAGALAKTLKDTYVCPYLFALEPTDISGPLTQFQVTRAEKEDTRKLVYTINRTLGDEALAEAKLDEYFEVWWLRLEELLGKIPRTPETSEPQRSDREILVDILGSVRALIREKTVALYEAPVRRPAPIRNLIEDLVYYGEAIDHSGMPVRRREAILKSLNEQIATLRKLGDTLRQEDIPSDF